MNNINITFTALNSYFLNTANNTINVDYLTDLIDITISNNKKVYDLLKTRMKTHSIVWCAFQVVANDCINEIEYPNTKNYIASSYQLKKWLDRYNLSYDIFSNLIEIYDEYRKEL